MIINQRGGSITIDNTTEQEKVNISQRSGSNITLANHVTSELATNNKQTLVINDEYKTVWGNSSEFIGKKKIIRTAEDTIQIKGTLDEEQIAAYEEWKKTYSPIAMTNAQFKINRGGYGYPKNDTGSVEDGAFGSSVTRKDGSHAPNPAASQQIHAVNNDLSIVKLPIGLRTYCLDSVSEYSDIQQFFCAGLNIGIGAHAFLGASFGAGIGASADVSASASIRLGICEGDDFITVDAQAGADTNIEVNIDTGTSVSAGVEITVGAGANLGVNNSTEGGSWSLNDVAASLADKLLELQDKLTAIELKMGNGGDEIMFSKRNNFAQIGAIFNDFPSVRIDEHGRSQQSSIVVGENGAFSNFIDSPLIERVDNSSTFPCGNEDVVIGNRMTRTVGAGGINLKTTGSIDLGGTKLTTGFKAVNMNASHGIHIGSEAFVEIQSLKCVTLKCNNQVYVDSSLGVKGNATIGGGLYVEGELFCHHITAPAEIHKTQDTEVFGGFSTWADRTTIIGECLIGTEWFPVFAVADPEIITMYPHSHHHVGPAMKLTAKNSEIRASAVQAGINSNNSVAQALARVNEDKLPASMRGSTVGGTGGAVNVGSPAGVVLTQTIVSDDSVDILVIEPEPESEEIIPNPELIPDLNIEPESDEFTESGDTVL